MNLESWTWRGPCSPFLQYFALYSVSFTRSLTTRAGALLLVTLCRMPAPASALAPASQTYNGLDDYYRGDGEDGRSVLLSSPSSSSQFNSHPHSHLRQSRLSANHLFSAFPPASAGSNLFTSRPALGSGSAESADHPGEQKSMSDRFVDSISSELRISETIVSSHTTLCLNVSWLQNKDAQVLPALYALLLLSLCRFYL